MGFKEDKNELASSTSNDVYGPEKRGKVMAAVRSKNTKPEMIVRSGLHMLGYRFRVHRKDLPGSPDLILKKYRTAIFVHGCFWHRHALCQRQRVPKQNAEYWEEKFAANVRRDTAVRDQLIVLGWNVIVVWECAINRTSYRWLEQLSNTLQHWYASEATSLSCDIARSLV